MEYLLWGSGHVSCDVGGALHVKCVMLQLRHPTHTARRWLPSHPAKHPSGRSSAIYIN